MFSVGELRLFGLIVQANSMLCCLPIDWDPVKYHIILTPKLFKRVMNNILRVFIVGYFSFVTVRLYPAFQGFGIIYPKYFLIYHVILGLFSGWTAMFCMSFMVYGEDIVKTYNEMVTLNSKSGMFKVANKPASSNCIIVTGWHEMIAPPP